MEIKDNLQNRFSHRQIKSEIINRLVHAFDTKEELSRDQYIRIEIPIENMDLLSWLDQNDSEIKLYWCDRKHSYEMAGLDQADYIKGQKLDNYTGLFNSINTRLSKGSANLRFFGGISFDPSQYIDEEWYLFGAYYFIIPRFEVIRKDKDLFFVCNHRMSKGNHTVQLKKLIEHVEQISFSSVDLSDGDPYLIKRLDVPEEKQWTGIIKTALNNIDQGVLEKIVLARKAIFEFSSDLNSFELLSKLRNINPESIHYCLQVRVGHSFIGSSPELLYTREGRQIYSEAIAGTRARGKNEIQDERLENELLSSQKDIREHRFVMDSVKESLGQVCTEMRSSDEISVLKLAQIQHLYANYSGKLKKDISDADLIAKLHPTPAVGGYPTEPSLSQIDKLEPFQRGWYASPIGWIGRDGAKFTIGIRSGLIDKNILYLFSGSGIVNGSHPRLEWEEIENKIANFLHILNINGDKDKQYIPATLHDKY